MANLPFHSFHGGSEHLKEGSSASSWRIRGASSAAIAGFVGATIGSVGTVVGERPELREIRDAGDAEEPLTSLVVRPVKSCIKVHMQVHIVEEYISPVVGKPCGNRGLEC